MANQARHQEQCSCPAPLQKHQHCVRFSTKGHSPTALLRTCIFTVEKRFPSSHANGISAFPFLRNPIILWRWWTLPSQLEANPTLISQPKLKKPHWSESVWKATERNRQERSRDRFQDIQQCKGNCSASSLFLS